ncbi:HAD family hydrolase [Saccharibacillus sp. JS10]|uniref:HAD family hydrolase n=1 Tax=Saccharibacillus sp. JS10 TaxID=2950552 RepID=UPI00210E7BB9|nr:HAD family hydrolase [Saccharibacillus sp. JS10]MCQ4088797.1 HAD family hydrolase [Saccharibacillus sp. JS10]
MMVIVFDLDDTLYDEITFVQSGLRAVADFLALRYDLHAHEIYSSLLYELEHNGRGKVFNNVLQQLGIYSQQNVNMCLQVYRKHNPQIKLFDDASLFLNQAPLNSVYIVTDGNKLVQHRKIQALGLYEHPAIKKVYISRRFGIHNEKPSPYCFHKICEKEDLEPEKIVYIGDNPAKDFVGIRPLGFRTIRIMRGNHKSVKSQANHEAEYQIDTLHELPNVLNMMTK